MLKYKKACKDTFLACLIIILKLHYLSTILTPLRVTRSRGVGGQLPCFSRLLLQSIAINLGRFFHFESILLEVTFIHSFTYSLSDLLDNVEGEKKLGNHQAITQTCY